MNITAILKKLAAGTVISAAEKEFLLANKDILSKEQVKAAEEAEVEEVDEKVPADEDDEEEVDEKAMKKLISKAIAERVDAITSEIAEKFVEGVADQRKRAIDSGKTQASKADEKTKGFMKALFSGDREYLKDISGLSDSAGGYLIPEELRSEILRIVQNQYGLARKDFRYLPFTGPGNERRIPALATSVTVTWTDEAAKKKSTAPTFNVITQTLKKLAAIVPMTEEILEDSTINLTALIAELFAEAVAKEEDLQFFNGDGTVWTGILRNGSVNVVNISGQNPNTITADDLLNMVDATPAGALDGAKFYMHRSVYSTVRRIKDSDGRYIVQQPTGDAPPSIWGWTIELVEAFPAANIVGSAKPIVLFGNLARAAIFGDKQQLRMKLLDQATVRNVSDDGDLNLAQQDMVAIRIVERVGYVLALPKAVTVLKTAV